MSNWVHMICGKISSFRNGVDPNAINAPCRNCGIALGGWAPA